MSEKFSKFISYFFHPINYPVVGTLIYFLFVPKYIYKPQEYLILTVIFIATYIIPVMILLVLKNYGMIESLHLRSINERKFPAILLVSIALVMGNWLIKSSTVDLLALLFYGYGLAMLFVYIALYFNYKISFHTLATSGLLGFVLCFSLHFQVNIVIILCILFITSGLIGSSRLRLKSHTLSEVILGYIIGICTQFIVYAIYNI
jgi:membrane-associated phospholipid phosphatase